VDRKTQAARRGGAQRAPDLHNLRVNVSDRILATSSILDINTHLWVGLHNGKLFSYEMMDPMPFPHSNYYLEREVFGLELWSITPSSNYRLGNANVDIFYMRILLF
jgi:hypothetical protein